MLEEKNVMITLRFVGKNISSIISEGSEDRTGIYSLWRDRPNSLNRTDHALPLPLLADNFSNEGSALLVTESQENNLTMISNQIEAESNQQQLVDFLSKSSCAHFGRSFFFDRAHYDFL